MAGAVGEELNQSPHWTTKIKTHSRKAVGFLLSELDRQMTDEGVYLSIN